MTRGRIIYLCAELRVFKQILENGISAQDSFLSVTIWLLWLRLLLVEFKQDYLWKYLLEFSNTERSVYISIRRKKHLMFFHQQIC